MEGLNVPRVAHLRQCHVATNEVVESFSIRLRGLTESNSNA